MINLNKVQGSNIEGQTAPESVKENNQKQTPASIYVKAGAKKYVELIKKEFSDDSFLGCLANLNEKKPNEITKKCIRQIKALDGDISNLSPADINIFKNAVVLYDSNKQNSINFSTTLEFMAQFSDIENANLFDNKFIEKTEKTQKAIKEARATENNKFFTLQIENFKNSDSSKYSTYEYSKKQGAIIDKTKYYENAEPFKVKYTVPTQEELLEKSGFTPDEKSKTYLIQGKEYKYDKKNDYLVNVQTKEKYFISEKEHRLVSHKEAFQASLKTLYGENFYNKNIEQELQKDSGAGFKNSYKPTNTEIQELKNDETSMLGQIMKFNDQNKNNPELKKLYNIDKINQNLEKLIKEKSLIVEFDPRGNGKFDGYSLVLNPQRLYDNTDFTFETLYHELIHSLQNNSMSLVESENQAYMGAGFAQLIRKNKFSAENKNNVREKTKYLLNYNLVGAQ